MYQGKKSRQKPRESSRAPKRSGKFGRYLSVLNWDSENGLSIDHVQGFRFFQPGDRVILSGVRFVLPGGRIILPADGFILAGGG